MILENQELLNFFRYGRVCEYCQKPLAALRIKCDPAHIITRGSGQVDIAGNIVSLCRYCHMHQGTSSGPSVQDMKDIASRREMMPWCFIEDAIRFIQRLPKNPSDKDVEKCKDELSFLSYNLVLEAVYKWRFRHPLGQVKKKKKKRPKPPWYEEAKKKQRQRRKETYVKIKSARKTARSAHEV